MKVEKETRIVHQDIWALHKQPAQPRIFIWKNPWPSRDLNPGPLACGASALPTELPGRGDKPGWTKYLQWYRGHGTQDKTYQSTRSIPDTYLPSLIFRIQLSYETSDALYTGTCNCIAITIHSSTQDQLLMLTHIS